VPRLILWDQLITEVGIPLITWPSTSVPLMIKTTTGHHPDVSFRTVPSLSPYFKSSPSNRFPHQTPINISCSCEAYYTPLYLRQRERVCVCVCVCVCMISQRQCPVSRNEIWYVPSHFSITYRYRTLRDPVMPVCLIRVFFKKKKKKKKCQDFGWRTWLSPPSLLLCFMLSVDIYVKITVSWVLTPCRLEDRHKYFVRKYCIQHNGRKVKAADSAETLVTIYHTTRRHSPENSNINIHRL
jgi:hypothetical protein